jgi:hypothetical protein
MAREAFSRLFVVTLGLPPSATAYAATLESIDVNVQLAQGCSRRLVVLSVHGADDGRPDVWIGSLDDE